MRSKRQSGMQYTITVAVLPGDEDEDKDGDGDGGIIMAINDCCSAL